MQTVDFYRIMDKELEEKLVKYKDDSFLIRNRSSVNNQKSYALLIWFLEFYGRRTNYHDFITDGNGDSSCDIIFDNYDNQGNKVFYIVQSKWNNENNCTAEINKDEILKSLSDFETILRGEKRKVNDKLKIKLAELDNHLKENGDVKFIFLSLSKYSGNANENIKSLINYQPRTTFDVIDIERLKINYIDRNFKKIEPINPLETYYDPDTSQITIEIAKLNEHNNNCIKIDEPFKAYMFLLRPKIIYELFKKYGFALFYKNVRNPLMQSRFNEEIEQTIIDEPAFFWYYNNGITAITYLLPAIRNQATTIKITGLQIINGAQTVYSIYKAYKNASPTKQMQMDNEAMITMRLLKSGGKNFDLNVTKYTNSQNPINDRDFCANEDIQINLQNNSYSTNIWYEKRSDEFRELPAGIIKVANSIFANVFLAYHLQDPISVIKNYQQFKQTNKDLIFISHKNHKEGLYEKIFDTTTKFEDMLCAFYVFDLLTKNTKYGDTKNVEATIYFLLTFFNITFTKYLKIKYDSKINVNRKIIMLYDNHQTEILLKAYEFINIFIQKYGQPLDITNFLKIKQALENYDLKIAEIETLQI